jgi:hypothetical protein
MEKPALLGGREVFQYATPALNAHCPCSAGTRSNALGQYHSSPGTTRIPGFFSFPPVPVRGKLWVTVAGVHDGNGCGDDSGGDGAGGDGGGGSFFVESEYQASTNVDDWSQFTAHRTRERCFNGLKPPGIGSSPHAVGVARAACPSKDDKARFFFFLIVSNTPRDACPSQGNKARKPPSRVG